MFLHPGDVFAARFEIDRVAGAGGMGTVYRARDRLTGAFIALKLLHGQGEDREPERFAREAEVLAELRHPGIVGYVAHGQAPTGQRFLAMEWLEGENLAQRLVRGRLTLAEALRLIQGVTEALRFAHERGIIHRDLKPTNLFLPDGDVGRVKVLDFGIARRLGVGRAMTRTGVVLGTPEYIAPEQARGHRDITPAADLFSLGCVLYECLVGEPPFAADHVAAVLVRILFEEPTPVESRRPGLPAAVVDLIRGMLAKDPAQRIADAGAVSAAIAALGEVAELPPGTTPQPRPASSPIGDEQGLFSLVVALPREGPDPEGMTLPLDPFADVRGHGTLLSIVRALGAQADVLAGSALVVSVPALGSATDQAIVAARCALAIAEKWPEARTAIVTGRGSMSRGLITGEVIDRAWRLLRAATAARDAASHEREGTVRVDPVSAGLLSGRFELTPADDFGFVLGSERMDDDPSRPLLGRPTLCVGRERELGILEATLAECCDDGVARGVVILAPPGVGKSRLRHEFLRRVGDRAGAILPLFGRGDPIKAQSSYAPLGEALLRCCGIGRGDDPVDQQAALRRWVAGSLPEGQVERVTEFLGELCGVPFSDRASAQLHAARQDPRVMADQVESAWLAILRALTGRHTVLLTLEDLHWCDALTIKLVGAAMRALSDRPLMVLGLARPEIKDLYADLWAGAAQSLPLHPLSRKASERLVRQILGPEVGAEAIGRMVEQAAGNPLFLEELIRAGAADKTSGKLPETVLAMLQARIGRLSPELRRTLRAASVFGETFWDRGVQRLLAATHEPDAASGALAELVREELIEVRQERQFPGEAEYRFRHAIMRDAAYILVGHSEATLWHTAAGEYLESVGERDAVVLAEHFRCGLTPERAAGHYLRAAEQASDAWDIPAALTFVRLGLDCGAEGELRGALLSIQISNAFWRGRFAEAAALAEEALALLPAGSRPWARVFESALFAAAIVQEHALLARLMAQFLAVEPVPEARSSYVRAAVQLAIMLYIAGQAEPAELLDHRAEQIGAHLTELDQEALAWLHAAECNRANHRDTRPQTYLRRNEQTAACARRAGDRRFLAASGSFVGKGLHDLGQPEAALKTLRESLQLAEQIEDETPLAYVRTHLARLLACSPRADDRSEARRLAELVLPTHNTPLVGLARGALAQVALRDGELDLAAAEARAACEILRPFPPYRLDIVALWSRILAAQGRDAEALQVCEEMVQQIEALGLESYGLLDLYIALAEARERAGAGDRVREVVARALAVLRRRLADVTEPELRASYLGVVPENVRVLELAAAQGWTLDDPAA